MPGGCSFTLFPRNAVAPPIMTGWAPGPATAAFFVETIMRRNEDVFRGLVRRLGAQSAELCARSRRPGEFVWVTVPARPHGSAQAINERQYRWEGT